MMFIFKPHKSTLSVMVVLTALSMLFPLLAGTVEVSTDSRFSGSYGMKVTLDGFSPAFVEDGTPVSEAHYRARFYVNTDGLQLNDGEAFELFSGFDTQGRAIFYLEIMQSSGSIQIRPQVRDNDGSYQTIAAINLPGSYTMLELEWFAGVPEGYLKLWVNDGSSNDVNSVVNFSTRLEWVRLGAVNGIDPSTAGYLEFDNFSSSQGEAIGPLPCYSIFLYENALRSWGETSSVGQLITYLNQPCF